MSSERFLALRRERRENREALDQIALIELLRFMKQNALWCPRYITWRA